MFDTRMIGVPNRPERGMIEIELPRGWIDVTSEPFRQADVGGHVLTYVAVLSAVEAAAHNARFKSRAEAILHSNLAAKGPEYLGRHVDEIAVQAAARVDQLLEMIRQEGYFSSWIVIEACTID